MYITKLFSRTLSVFLLLAMIGAALPGGARAAATITVNSTADSFGTDDFCTLREAITNANDNSGDYPDCMAGSGNDTIVFDSILGTATIALGSALPVINDGAGLTIDGGNRITISGSDSVRVLYVNTPGVLALMNISVTHGKDTQAAGLYNSNSTVTITHSTFSNNNATGTGGGLVNVGTMTITGSTFRDNSATSGDGGGAYNGGTLIIANSTFSNNSASGAGGGLSNNNGTATILNSTFSGNQAGSSGGALSTWKGSTTAPTTILRNTILANSVAPGGDCWNNTANGAVLSGENNIIESTSTCSSVATLTSDPSLGNLTGSPAYFPLLAGSPAIDAGSNTTCAGTPVSNASQNGIRRPQGTYCEIGSYEAPLNHTFLSDATADGWVLESSETSNAGGTLNNTALVIRLGDDAAKRQYRSILSFNTGPSLPDSAVITQVTLRVRRTGIAGAVDPITLFLGFRADIKKGFFGTAAALEAVDFQAAGNKTFGPFSPTLSGGWYAMNLTGAKAYINRLATNGGLTQIRLRFTQDDNNDAVANFLSLSSGNAASANRPQLVITYYVP